MKRRKEISLLGALVVCVVAIAVHKILKLDDPKDPILTKAD